MQIGHSFLSRLLLFFLPVVDGTCTFIRVKTIPICKKYILSTSQKRKFTFRIRPQQHRSINMTTSQKVESCTLLTSCKDTASDEGRCGCQGTPDVFPDVDLVCGRGTVARGLVPRLQGGTLTLHSCLGMTSRHRSHTLLQPARSFYLWSHCKQNTFHLGFFERFWHRT